MRILLTGASGFLGRHVLACLQECGTEVIVAGRGRPDSLAANAFIEADLLATSDLSGIVKAAKATHLLHLAWYAEHGKYWTSPLNLRWVDATTRLAEAFCQAGGKRMVFAGTCAEYDWSYNYCLEDVTPSNPATLYGVAKDAARRLVSAIGTAYQVPCTWGRVFLPFGAGENRQRLIPSLVDVLSGRRPAFGVNATAYRDFMHASDVAQGFVAMLKADTAGIFNICSGQPVQIGQLVKDIAALLKVDPSPILRLASERAGEPSMLAGANAKLKALQWEQGMELSIALARTVQEIVV